MGSANDRDRSADRADGRLKASQNRFPVDENVKATFPHAPDGHVRRCQGVVRSTGNQCQRYAVTGRKFCPMHGGRAPMGRKTGRYASSVGTTLKERLELLRTESPVDRLDISDEIDMARETASRAIELYDRFVVQEETNKDGEVASIPLKHKLTEGVKKSLTHVTQLVEKMARIQALTSASVPVSQIDFILNQMSSILEKHVENEELRAKIIEELESIDIPEDKGLQPGVVISIGD